jgi:peptide/nickel transport system substrate-binding protein
MPAADPLRLRIGTALPPAGLRNTGVGELVRGLYGETLLGSDRNGSARARLCEKWEWLDNDTILKLTLRTGVSFHDGTPLDAETAATLLRQIFADKRGSPPVSYGSVRHVKVLDTRTLQVHLSRPEALLPEDLADARMTKDLVGTGPFVVADVSAEAATLGGYPGYYLGRPHVEQVEIKVYPSPRSAWSAMMRGDINVLHEVSRDAAPFIEAESSVRTYPMLRSYVQAIFFNVRHPVLARRDVRQALSYAIDRDALVRDVMRGRGERADGPVWKYHWAYSTTQRTYDYNPELARVKLDTAGFSVRTEEEKAGARMPSRFRFTCLLMGNDSRYERIALVMQKQLYQIGVDMQIEAVPADELMQRMSTGRFDALFADLISGRSLTWLYRQWHSSPVQPGKLNTGYTSADAALDRLRETHTEGDVKGAVGSLQQIFYDDPPGLFVSWSQTSRAVSAQIQVPYESNMDVVGRLWRAQWASAVADAR